MGEEYTTNMLVELEPGGLQMVLLSWVSSRQAYSIQYSWMASTRLCSVCGIPVGCPVEDRFDGKYLEFDLSNVGQGSKLVHSECRDVFKTSLQPGGKMNYWQPMR